MTFRHFGSGIVAAGWEDHLSQLNRDHSQPDSAIDMLEFVKGILLFGSDAVSIYLQGWAKRHFPVLVNLFLLLLSILSQLAKKFSQPCGLVSLCLPPHHSVLPAS